MKSFAVFLVLILSSAIGLSQDAFAKFIIDGQAYEVKIDPDIASRLKIGSNVMVGATDGISMSLTAQFPGPEVGEWELTGSYQPPMVSVALSAKEVFLMQTGKLVVTNITEDGWVEGQFSGTGSLISNSKTSAQVSGSFRLKLP